MSVQIGINDADAAGGNSGGGSYNDIAQFKAKIVNNFVKDNNVDTVVEFGFGDGAQLTLAKYPLYMGFDVSPTIYAKTSHKFKDDKTKEFSLYDGHVIPGMVFVSVTV